jgi:hypothetical protein
MARIRTIKPEFFRHEGLQDLELANPGAYTMMVFAGLWGHCDAKGRFEWRPRQLKLDILPFLPFDMAKTLDLLSCGGLVKRYSVAGKEYGEIASFGKHQRLTGKEATEGEKYPAAIEEEGERSGKHQGNIGERLDAQEGKGREKEGEGKGVLPPPALPSPAEKNSETELQAACKATWAAYRDAYTERYGAPPIRDAKGNTAIKEFVKSVGKEVAPSVARYYLTHGDAFYVRQCHPPELMRKDARKLHTEWVTGSQMTATRAMQSDRTAANLASHNGALAILEARGLV